MIKRKTAVSSTVLDVLKHSENALSVPQLLEILAQKDLKPNKTTVYRLMDKLVADHTVSLVTVNNGTTYYELSKNHHHHFFCNSCAQLFCLTSCHFDSIKFDLNTLLPNPKFKISNHDFNLYGTCEPCSKERESA